MADLVDRADARRLGTPTARLSLRLARSGRGRLSPRAQPARPTVFRVAVRPRQALRRRRLDRRRLPTPERRRFPPRLGRHVWHHLRFALRTVSPVEPYVAGARRQRETDNGLARPSGKCQRVLGQALEPRLPRPDSSLPVPPLDDALRRESRPRPWFSL